MKFGGDFGRNFSNANGSNNLDYKKDIILDEVAKLIELDRGSILATLKDAGYYNISPKVSKKELIDLVVDALYSSEQFRHDIAIIIAKSNSSYSNAFGDKFKGLFSGKDKDKGSASSAGSGAGGINVGADPISAVAGAIGAIFSLGASRQNRKATEEETKQQLYDKLLVEQKTNWTPIIIVSGVLIIGAIVTFFALKGRNKNTVESAA